MANEQLLAALMGVNYSPLETPYGMGATTVARAVPSLYNPYANVGTNLGVTLGGALVAGLLGYQARQQAREQNLALQPLVGQAFKATTPEELQAVTAQPGGERLTDLVNQLYLQQIASKQSTAQTQADLKKAVIVEGIKQGKMPTEFAKLFEPVATTGEVPLLPGLTPQESKDVFIAKLKKEQDVAVGEAAIKRKNALAAVQDLKKTFEDLKLSGAEFNYQKAIPGTPAELAFSKLKGTTAALAIASGQTSQLSDVDLQQQMDSILGPQIMGVPLSGTDSIAKRLEDKLKTSKQFDLEAPAKTTSLEESPAQKRNRELKERLANLEKLMGQAGK